MHFGSNNPKRSYEMNKVTLESSNQEKVLGVTIDVSLKFRVHAAVAVKKANQALGILKKAYTSRDGTTITSLYNTMVRPHLG